MCFITKKHQIKGTYIAKTFTPPPPPPKKKMYGYSEADPIFLKGDGGYQSGHQTICKSTSNCPLSAPKKLQIRNRGLPGICCFPSTTTPPPPPHIYCFHSSYCFSTRQAKIRPKRPKSGQKSQTQITFVAG